MNNKYIILLMLSLFLINYDKKSEPNPQDNEKLEEFDSATSDTSRKTWPEPII